MKDYEHLPTAQEMIRLAEIVSQNNPLVRYSLYEGLKLYSRIPPKNWGTKYPREDFVRYLKKQPASFWIEVGKISMYNLFYPFGVFYHKKDDFKVSVLLNNESLLKLIWNHSSTSSLLDWNGLANADILRLYQKYPELYTKMFLLFV